jgi:methyl-accepting chemotaxis protein
VVILYSLLRVRFFARNSLNRGYEMFGSKKNDDLQATLNALDASQAVIEFKPDGEILTANSNFINAVNYSLEEIKGKHHQIFCDPNYVRTPEYATFWKNLAAGIFQAGEFKRFDKKGNIIWLQASYNPIRNQKGEVVKIIKFAADITAEKNQSMDSKGKIDAINRSQAVIEFTPNGEILWANDNFLNVLGYSLGEIKGNHHKMFCEPKYVNSPEYSHFWEDLRQGKFQAAEYKRIGKNGREIYIQASYNPIFDDQGAIIKVVKFATDITEVVMRRMRNENLSAGINQDLGSVVGQVALAAEMTSKAAAASTETGAIVNSVAAAAEEMSQSVSEISSNMMNAKANVEGVFSHAEAANKSADNLSQSAAQMNNIVTIIQDIAGQINLLALNATIESARAGEAGRGFAVVASEVKTLASQVSNSTQTIGTEIANMQSVSNEVVQSLGLISKSMNSVLENVASVATAIEQQNAVTLDISENMQQAVGAVSDISASLEEINGAFGVVADASEKVKTDVEALVA